MGARFYGYYDVMSTIKIEHRDPGSPHLCVVAQGFSSQNVQKVPFLGTPKKPQKWLKKGNFLGNPCFLHVF